MEPISGNYYIESEVTPNLFDCYLLGTFWACYSRKTKINLGIPRFIIYPYLKSSYSYEDKIRDLDFWTPLLLSVTIEEERKVLQP